MDCTKWWKGPAESFYRGMVSCKLFDGMQRSYLSLVGLQVY